MPGDGTREAVRRSGAVDPCIEPHRRGLTNGTLKKRSEQGQTMISHAVHADDAQGRRVLGRVPGRACARRRLLARGRWWAPDGMPRCRCCACDLAAMAGTSRCLRQARPDRDGSELWGSLTRMQDPLAVWCGRWSKGSTFAPWHQCKCSCGLCLLLAALLSFPSPQQKVIAQRRLSTARHQHDHAAVFVLLASYPPLFPANFALSRKPHRPPTARENIPYTMDARQPHPFSQRPPAHGQSNHPPPSPPHHSNPPPHFGGYTPATSQPQPQPPVHMPFSADPYPSARRDPFFPQAAAQHVHHVSPPEHAPPGDRQFGWGGTGTLDSSLKTLGTLPHEPLLYRILWLV